MKKQCEFCSTMIKVEKEKEEYECYICDDCWNNLEEEK